MNREINPNAPILYQKVDEMELSIRPKNCLKKANIIYVGQLIQKSYDELLAIPFMGRISVNQIKEVLQEMVLSLQLIILKVIE